jgi:diphthamide synthase (EF-2-diphthine--ammonia ligase)
LDELKAIALRQGMNLAGEGGEYETLTIDSPMHRRALKIIEKDIRTSRDGGSLNVVRAVLEAKE